MSTAIHDTPLEPTDVDKNAGAPLMHTSSLRDTQAPERKGRAISVLLPSALVVLVVSWGFATVILVWLLSRRVYPEGVSATEAEYFKRALVAREVLREPTVGADGSVVPHSRFYGLAISSIASTLILTTIPFYMAIVAYWAAAEWIRDQSLGRAERLPTPMQYGLLLELCGSSGLSNVYDALSYFWKTRAGRRPAIVPSLLRAFIILVSALAIGHSIGLADLWLHTTTSSFIHIDTSTISGELAPLGAQINYTVCPGPVLGPGLSTTPAYYNCGLNQEGQWKSPNGKADMMYESLAGMQNLSNRFSIQHVRYNATELAYLLPRFDPPSDFLSANISTFALSTTCAAAPGCVAHNKFLPGIPSQCPELNSTNFNLTQSIGSNQVVHPSTYNGNTLHKSSNPSDVFISLWYPYDRSVYQPDMSINGSGWRTVDTVWQQLPAIYFYYYASCRLTVYNVTVELKKNSQPVILQTVLSNINTTSALSAFSVFGYPSHLELRVSSPFPEFLHSSVQYSLQMDPTSFLTALAGNFSVAALGLASPLLTNSSALSATVGKQQTINRYPLAPLIVVLCLHYLYGLGALVLFLRVWWGSSRMNRRSESQSGGDSQHIDGVDVKLAQVNLRNSLTLVLDRFDDKRWSGGGDESSLSVVDMEDLHSNEERLVLQERSDLNPLRGRHGVVVRRHADEKDW